MNNITEEITKKIAAGQVAMRPRWQFVLQGLLWATATIVVALLAVYFFSFVLFVLRENGVLFAPLFGAPGLFLFFTTSPWLLIGVAGMFLLLLYILVSHYAFSYKKPLVYSLLALVLVTIIMSAVIQRSTFHERTRDFAEQRGVPMLAPLYRQHQDRPPRDVQQGTVIAVSETGFVITTNQATAMQVLVTDKTKVPPQSIVVSDEVLVFGPTSIDEATGEVTVTAFGVRLDDGHAPAPMQRQMPPRVGE